MKLIVLSDRVLNTKYIVDAIIVNTTNTHTGKPVTYLSITQSNGEKHGIDNPDDIKSFFLQAKEK